MVRAVLPRKAASTLKLTIKPSTHTKTRGKGRNIPGTINYLHLKSKINFHSDVDLDVEEQTAKSEQPGLPNLFVQ